VGDRPVWVAASTHPGEEAEVLAAHGVLLERFGDCLLVLVPRHPERRDEVTGLVRAAGLRHGLRGAQGAPPARQDQVYVADTLGEMALWYHLGGPVFLGGSWVPVGGHNPFEPAAAGAPVLHGPLHANFDAVFAALDAAGGGRTVRDGPELAAAVTGIWRNSQMRTQMEAAALGFAADQRQSIDGLVGQVLSLVQG
jgi:3-deoxy-D-manno-octulosonic-acid transferase